MHFSVVPVPRRAESFQVDIYPDTPGPYPALSPAEWISGLDRDPILVSLNDRIEGTNMPKITTYQTLDSNPVLTHRTPLQRPVQLPIAEVAPTPKSSVAKQSLPASMSIEKLALDIEQQQQQHQQSGYKGLKKIESVKIPMINPEFNHIRCVNFVGAVAKRSLRDDQLSASGIAVCTIKCHESAFQS